MKSAEAVAPQNVRAEAVAPQNVRTEAVAPQNVRTEAVAPQNGGQVTSRISGPVTSSSSRLNLKKKERLLCQAHAEHQHASWLHAVKTVMEAPGCLAS